MAGNRVLRSLLLPAAMLRLDNKTVSAPMLVFFTNMEIMSGNRPGLKNSMRSV